MKKNSFLYVLTLVSVTIIGCNDDDETIALPQNQSPRDFSVVVSQTTTNSTLLKWNEAVDPDGDPVTYTITLEGNEIVSGIAETEYLLKELLPKTNYSGSVIASDGKNGESKNTFMITTNELVDDDVTIAWQKSLGGSSDDNGYVVIQTNDGGYLVGGTSESIDGDVTENNGQKDCWVIKLDELGNIIWDVNFGGSGNETIHDLKQTIDGGYIIAGYSRSNDGDIFENKGSADGVLIKTDISGNLQWKKVIGGSGSEGISDIKETTDGGYITIGNSNSSDIDVQENNGAFDFWILRLQSNGEIVWQKNLGGEGNESAFSIEETSDGGFIAAGTISDIMGSGEGTTTDFNYWVVKLE